MTEYEEEIDLENSMEYGDDSLDAETLAEMDENEDDRDGQYYEYSYGSLIDRIEKILDPAEPIEEYNEEDDDF